MSDNSKTQRNIWIVVISVLILAPLVLVSLYAAGAHSGAEFSPDDFSRRSFTYNQTPWLNWVIHKKKYYDGPTDLETNLVTNGFITVKQSAKKAWHLTRDSYTNPALISHDCDARFLTQYLDLVDDRDNGGENYWLAWNDKYPRSAKVFWPLIADMARHEMYLRIPDVMKMAMDIETDDPENFLPRAKELVSSLYLELGTLDLELGNTERARPRLVRAKQLGMSEKAEPLLARCNESSSSEDILLEDEEPELVLVIPPKKEPEEEEEAADEDSETPEDSPSKDDDEKDPESKDDA